MNELPPQLSLVRPAAPADAGQANACADERSDDDLILLARAETPGAFSQLVQRHQARALRVASRRLGRSLLTAADVVQNTLFQIYLALPRYQPRGQFRSYLFRVLMNQCRMAERAARVEARGRLMTEAPVGTSQEAAVLLRERERIVESAIGRLSAKLRDVVLLRYTGELSYDEIAVTLGVPVGTVKRRLFDAMEKLRDLVEAP